MNRQAKIVVVGSLNMDLVVSAPRIPHIGETIIGGGFSTIYGGKGANQAVASCRLGAKVDMIGCVGNDQFGHQILNQLSIEKVGNEHISVIPNISTGVALVTVSEKGENSIVVSPGANSKLSPNLVRAGEGLIKNADILIVQLEIPLEAVSEAVLLAQKHGITVILNPAPAREMPISILQNVNIITPNETEGKQLLSKDATSIIPAKQIIINLLKKGIEKVVLTQGENGVFYNNGTSINHVPTYKVKVVDTTAAGDAFNAGLGVALAEGFSFEDSIQFAQKVGALTVTKHGAQPSLPTRIEVDNFSTMKKLMK